MALCADRRWLASGTPVSLWSLSPPLPIQGLLPSPNLCQGYPRAPSHPPLQVSTDVTDLLGQFGVLGLSPYNSKTFFDTHVKHSFGQHSWR